MYNADFVSSIFSQYLLWFFCVSLYPLSWSVSFILFLAVSIWLILTKKWVLFYRFVGLEILFVISCDCFTTVIISSHSGFNIPEKSETTTTKMEKKAENHNSERGRDKCHFNVPRALTSQWVTRTHTHTESQWQRRKSNTTLWQR